MIKLLTRDISGTVPYPEAHNPMLYALRGLRTGGGTSLAGKFPHITLVLTDGYESPPGLVDYFTVGGLRVVSSRLKAVLESANAEMEYFSVRVLYKDVPTKEMYYVANPLLRVKGIDLERSEVEVDPELGDALSVTKLVLDESKFEGIQLAVIDEIMYTGVQPSVASAIEASECTGCAFIDPITVDY